MNWYRLTELIVCTLGGFTVAVVPPLAPLIGFLILTWIACCAYWDMR